LRDTILNSTIDKDLTSTHQTTFLRPFIDLSATGDLPETAKKLISTISRTSVMYFLPIIHKPNSSLVFLIVSWHPWNQIFQNFRGTHKFFFTMDVKSLYTVIPHHDGLRALKFFLDKRPNHEPSTAVLVRLAELQSLTKPLRQWTICIID
jgi:hypothetical protein